MKSIVQVAAESLGTTEFQGGFMEGVLGLCWVPWAFQDQLQGSTSDPRLLPPLKVTSPSTACAALLPGLGCLLNLVNLFTA